MVLKLTTSRIDSRNTFKTDLNFLGFLESVEFKGMFSCAKYAVCIPRTSFTISSTDLGSRRFPLRSRHEMVSKTVSANALYWSVVAVIIVSADRLIYVSG